MTTTANTIIANTHQAKTRLSGLIEQALQGDEVIIARDGVPCVRLVPISPENPQRQGGEFRGRITGDFLGSLGSDDAPWG
jgi:prevent-host-death family protein